MDMYSYANMSTYPFLDSKDIGKKIDMQQSGGYQKNYGENDKKILAGGADTDNGCVCYRIYRAICRGNISVLL